jgi:hypothetical protein
MKDNGKVINIIEISSPNHSNLIESWLSIFQCNESSNVNVFLDKETHERMSDTEHVVLAANKAKLLFQLISIMRNSDHVIFNSIQTNFFMFLFLVLFKKGKLTLCIHNSNAWQGITSGPLIKKLIKKVCRRLILIRIDTLAFCSEAVLDSFKVYTDKEKIVVPFQLSACPIKVLNIRNEDKVVVVYPGIISKTRKQYIEIIEAFKILGNSYQLYLLGKPNKQEGGDEIVSLCKNHSNIFTYQTFVSQDDFSAVMESSDFLISDLGSGRFKRYDYIEQYGQTKDSGVSHLIAKYHKPAILNHDFSTSFKGDNPILSFKKPDDIVNILTKFRHSGYSISLSKNLLDISINTQASKIYEKIKHVYF